MKKKSHSAISTEMEVFFILVFCTSGQKLYKMRYQRFFLLDFLTLFHKFCLRLQPKKKLLVFIKELQKHYKRTSLQEECYYGFTIGYWLGGGLDSRFRSHTTALWKIQIRKYVKVKVVARAYCLFLNFFICFYWRQRRRPPLQYVSNEKLNVCGTKDNKIKLSLFSKAFK